MNLVAITVMMGAALAQLEPLEPLEALEPDESAELAPLEAFDPIVEQPKLIPNFPAGTTLFINASSLALRTGPNREAGLIRYIERNGRVISLPDVLDPVPLEIGNNKGQWIYVQYQEHKGYVFDAYLLRAPPALNESLDWICEPGKRVGPITSKTTYEDMVLIFSEVNISDAEIPLGDGKFEKGTAIFPGNAAQQLIVQWEIPKVKPKTIMVGGTKWHTAEGVGPGVRLSKLVELNGGPLSFAGFDWDYAGFITSWRGGKLEEKHVLQDHLLAYLAVKKPYLPEDFEALKGDREFSSDVPEAGRLNLHISSMTIMLND